MKKRLRTHLGQLWIRGQGLVEFALVLPLLLLLLFGLVEFGRIFQAWLTLEHAARQAARYAASGVYNTDYCDDVVVLSSALSSLSAAGSAGISGWLRRGRRQHTGVVAWLLLVAWPQTR